LYDAALQKMKELENSSETGFNELFDAVKSIQA
jgi:hypothetical protein